MAERRASKRVGVREGRRRGDAAPDAPGGQACEIRLRAERKAGQLLAQMEKAKGARFAGREPDGSPRRSPDATAEKTLADLGISKGQSSRWQKLADVSCEFRPIQDGPTSSYCRRQLIDFKLQLADRRL
jgi:hypothetical protein